MLEPDSFDEAIPTIYKAVTKLTEAVDGYNIPLTPRVKKALFPDLVIRYNGTLGWFVPLFQEICVVNESYPEAIAHEVAHRSGIPAEKQAVFYSMVKRTGGELTF